MIRARAWEWDKAPPSSQRGAGESKNLRKSDRIGQKICVNLCESVESVGQELVQNVKVCVNLTE